MELISNQTYLPSVTLDVSVLSDFEENKLRIKRSFSVTVFSR